MEYLVDQASSDGIRCIDINWHTESVQFMLHASASNLLRPTAPSVDYQFQVTCHKDGSITIKGDHNRFPFYEIYKQVDFQDYELIYTHNFQKNNGSTESLDGPIEYQFST